MKGSLTMVIGNAGSGKSSLGSVIIGDIEKQSGEVKYTESVAYYPQPSLRSDYVAILSLLRASLFIWTQRRLRARSFFYEMQLSSTDKQGPDKELMTYNYAAEHILTLARIRAELQDPVQTKDQLLQAGFGEDDLDLRSGDTKRKYRIVIKSLLDEDFRKNLLAASESLVSKPKKRTRAQQDGDMAMDAKIKLELNSWQPDSINLTDNIEQTPNSESSSQQTQNASRKRFRKEILKQCRCKSVRPWEINQEDSKYRWTGNEIPIKIQQLKTNIEKGDQYGDAMTALSASQSTAQTAYAKTLEGRSIEDECKHIFKLSTVRANALTQLKEGINLPYLFRIVAANNVLPPDIITEDTMERIKRYTEQKNLEYKATAMAMQFGTTFLQQLFNPNSITYLAPPHIYNQVQQYYNQQPGGFLGDVQNFKACGDKDAIADVEYSKPTFKQERMPSQCFHAIHELRRKNLKAHPHHKAN
ncbi:MAG: hypothetical protein EZS28_005965 [Streblomastix strix]|uniref:Uncharacterized protein n=1 Tax=Streblomastix strix TaxID=222440 RepID=A0A5J4WWA0_9EUKA|nr:MAG: hypothetical protein EZS28_005965 [Streblomastix strix]